MKYERKNRANPLKTIQSLYNWCLMHTMQACQVCCPNQKFPDRNTFSRSPYLNQKSPNFAQNFSFYNKNVVKC